MATRSTISITDGKTTKTIYCHWDGYPSNNGQTLLDHYQDEKKINELIALGDISFLDKNINPTEKGLTHKRDEFGAGVYDENHQKVMIETTEPHSYEKPHEGVVVAYMRDRGENGCERRLYDGARPNEGEAYDYLFKNGQWYVRHNKNFVKLTQSFIDNHEE